MDYTFEVIISKRDLASINIPELKVEWGGEVFSQDPKRYKFGRSFHFFESTDLTYYSKYITGYFEEQNYLALLIELRCLKELELEVNGSSSGVMINEFSDFLNEIYKAEEPFCILLGIDDELFIKRYSLMMQMKLGIYC